MSVTTAPIILLPGSLCVNNFGGKSLPRFFERFLFFISRRVLDAADDPRPMRHPTFVANNLQVLNLAVAGL